MMKLCRALQVLQRSIKKFLLYRPCFSLVWVCWLEDFSAVEHEVVGGCQ